MSRPEVIILGAGAAGLMAADALSEKCNVTIIESAAAPGGRIRSLPLKAGEGVIEAGAEFVHGTLPVTRQLLQEARLTLLKIEGKMFRKERGEWKEQHEMIEGWDELLQAMKEQQQDVTMHDLLMKHFGGEANAALRRHVYQYVQGFDVADPAKVSVQSLYKEWSAEEEDLFRIKEGYGAVIGFLAKKVAAKGCRIVLNETIRQIDWQQNSITAYNAARKKYTADRLLITLPVGVMTATGGSCSLNLTPPADECINAYRNTGFGGVVKVALEFREKFWPNDMSFAFGDEMIPTWWTQLPLENNLLIGWAGGPVANRIAAHTDDELLEIGLRSAASIFGINIEECKNNLCQSFVFNWSANKNSLGAYSYATPASRAALEILNKSLIGTVFFAGEGLFEGEYPGTVEAAFMIGKQAAMKMIETM